ncbi:FAR-17a/AIG1-like protein [Phycomyces nitens]|nr:FAR-17a/AIG1-like protein [Phycomyces nitens]
MAKHIHPGSLLLNTVGLYSNVYAFRSMTKIPFPLGFGGLFQFLTIISLTASTVTFTLQILRFFFPKQLQGAYQTISSLATPMEGLVSLMYWPMMLHSRDLLVPKGSPFDLPLVLDLSLHLWPTVILYIDLFLFNTEYKRSRENVTAIYVFCALYFFWSSYCESVNGFWVYPFLGLFSVPGRAAFFVVCATVCVGIYELGSAIHSKIHTVSKPTLQAKKAQ